MAISLQNIDTAEKNAFPWGWIRWVMSDKLEAGAAQTVGVVQIDPGQRNPLHIHPNCEELLYVTAGQAEHILDGDSVTMNVGDMIRIPKGVPHYAKCVSEEPLQAMIIFDTGVRETEFSE